MTHRVAQLICSQLLAKRERPVVSGQLSVVIGPSSVGPSFLTMPTVDLVCLSEAALTPPWGLGGVFAVRPEPESVAKAVEQLTGTSTAAAVLFWDASFGTPDQELVQKLISYAVVCWKKKMKLGMNGLPGIIRFVSPTWMLTCDPSRNIQATSWRLSLRVCLVRTEVLRSLGGPRPEFQSLDGAGLELGHRWIRRGALMRHVPRLLGEGGIEDGRSKIEDRRSEIEDRGLPSSISDLPSPISHLPSPASGTPRVSVLIPTLDR